MYSSPNVEKKTKYFLFFLPPFILHNNNNTIDPKLTVFHKKNPTRRSSLQMALIFPIARIPICNNIEINWPNRIQSIAFVFCIYIFFSSASNIEPGTH